MTIKLQFVICTTLRQKQQQPRKQAGTAKPQKESAMKLPKPPTHCSDATIPILILLLALVSRGKHSLKPPIKQEISSGALLELNCQASPHPLAGFYFSSFPPCSWASNCFILLARDKRFMVDLWSLRQVSHVRCYTAMIPFRRSFPVLTTSVDGACLSHPATSLSFRPASRWAGEMILSQTTLHSCLLDVCPLLLVFSACEGNKISGFMRFKYLHKAYTSVVVMSLMSSQRQWDVGDFLSFGRWNHYQGVGLSVVVVVVVVVPKAALLAQRISSHSPPRLAIHVLSLQRRRGDCFAWIEPGARAAASRSTFCGAGQ